MRRCQSSSSGRTMPRNTLLGLWRHWAGRLDDRARGWNSGLTWLGASAEKGGSTPRVG